jgi:hypothetical protein
MILCVSSESNAVAARRIASPISVPPRGTVFGPTSLSASRKNP